MRTWIMRSVAFIAIACLTALNSPAGAQDRKEPTGFEQSEELARRYLEAFQKSGIPSPKGVEAAVTKAKSAGTIEAWREAANIANVYANVIDVLTSHYSQLYNASRSSRGPGDHALISKAADYERIRNRYLQIRNDAYIEAAKLYLAKGDAPQALSYVTTAVKLSGVHPNTAGEALIKQIIQFDQ